MIQKERQSGKYHVFQIKQQESYDTNIDVSTLDEAIQRQEENLQKLSKSKQAELINRITKNFHVDSETWKNMVLKEYSEIENAEYICLIFHDKDQNEDGSPIGLHFHAIVKFKNLQHLKSVRTKFSPHNTRKQNLDFTRSEGSQLRYLTHTTEQAMIDKKHRYEISDLILFLADPQTGHLIRQDGNQTKEWYTRKISEDFKSQNLSNNQGLSEQEKEYIAFLKTQVLEGKTHSNKVSELLKENFGSTRAAEIYTPALDKHLQTLRDQFIIMLQRNGKKRLSNIWISGPGGIGKTKTAEALSQYIHQKDKTEGTFTANSSSKQINSIWDGYDYEPISLLNEISYAYSQEEFCDYFDMIKEKNVQNRYKNKINRSRYCIFTKSDSFETFTRKIGTKNIALGTDAEDKIWQVQRRFEAVIELVEQEQTTYLKISRPNKTTKTMEVVRTETYWTEEELDNLDPYVTEIFDFIYNLCQD